MICDVRALDTLTDRPGPAEPADQARPSESRHQVTRQATARRLNKVASMAEG
jgi:hypothetical protein